LLKVADEFVRVDASILVGLKDLMAKKESARENDNDRRNTEKVARYFFVFTLCIQNNLS